MVIHLLCTVCGKKVTVRPPRGKKVYAAFIKDHKYGIVKVTVEILKKKERKSA